MWRREARSRRIRASGHTRVSRWCTYTEAIQCNVIITKGGPCMLWIFCDTRSTRRTNKLWQMVACITCTKRETSINKNNSGRERGLTLTLQTIPTVFNNDVCSRWWLIIIYVTDDNFQYDSPKCREHSPSIFIYSVICYYSLDFMVLYHISWASGADSIILHLGLISWILRGLQSMDYFTCMSQTLV